MAHERIFLLVEVDDASIRLCERSKSSEDVLDGRLDVDNAHTIIASVMTDKVKSASVSGLLCC